MHAQIITYQLNDISQAEYLKQMVEPDAPILAEVKGLISKVWLADIEKKHFWRFLFMGKQSGNGRFYEFRLGKSSCKPTVRKECFFGRL